ncbi:unnamed protein product [Calypogeia fissa]
MSSFSSNSQLVPKLVGGNNFKTWKHLCQSSVESSGIWHHVDSSAAPPTKNPDKKDYIFQEPLRLYRAHAATTRTIIVGSCSPQIQQTLEQLTTAFHRFTYNGERMDDYCNTYLTAIERCGALNIEIQDKVRVIRFINSVEAHFDQWAFSQRQNLRNNPTQLPSLKTLMQQVRDEYQRRMQQADAQLQALYPSQSSSSALSSATPLVAREPPRHICSYCTLSRHKEDRCFYKHPHLRRSGWKPVAAILQKIQDRQSLQPTLQTFVIPSSHSEESSISHFDDEFVSGHFLTVEASAFLSTIWTTLTHGGSLTQGLL